MAAIASGEPVPAARVASYSRTVLLTLASARFLMTVDSSVMNVSMTVANDVGTRSLAFRRRSRSRRCRGVIDDQRWEDRPDPGPEAGVALRCVIYGLGSLTTSLAPNLAVLLIGWSLLEGVGLGPNHITLDRDPGESGDSGGSVVAIIALFSSSGIPARQPGAQP